MSTDTIGDTSGLVAGPPPLTGRVSAMVAAWRRSGVANFGWAGLSQTIGLALRLAASMILARLLSPRDYGVFATAMAVVVTLEWFSDLGVLPSLLRHPLGGTRTYLDTGWWIGLYRGLALTLISGALALPLSRYYGQPELFAVLLVLSTRSTLYALRSPGTPTLRRDLDYRGVFLEEIALMLVGTAASLTLAWLTHSVWAIVGGTLTGVAAAVVASYALRPGLPRLTLDRGVVAELSHMSRQIFFNTATMAVWMNADRLLGLRFATPDEMGLYAVAWNLSSVLEGLALHGCDVYYAMLARQADPEERDAWHAWVCDRIAWWLTPILALGVLGGPLLIRVLYDSRYAGAGPILAILMGRLIVRVLGLVQFQHLLATARVWVATRAFLLAVVAQVVLLPILGRNFGVLGVAASGLLSTLVLTGTQAAIIHAGGQKSLKHLAVTTVWLAVSGLVYVAIYGLPRF